MNEIEQKLLPAPIDKSGPSHKAAFAFLIVFIVLAVIAALYYGPWLSTPALPRGTRVAVEPPQRLSPPADIEARVAALEMKVADLNAQLASNTSSPGAGGGNTTAIASADLARIQSDMVAMSAALDNVQAEVKRTGSSAVQNQQTNQAMLAAAIAFIQLRDAATSGQVFTSELLWLRNAARNDSGLQDLIGKLEPYAAKPVPTVAGLHEQLIDLEGPAIQALNRSSAQNWWQKIVAEMSGLISVRHIHGQGTPDAFAKMENDLAVNDVNAVLDDLRTLPPEVQDVLKDWQNQAVARQQIGETLHAMSERLTSPVETKDTAP